MMPPTVMEQGTLSPDHLTVAIQASRGDHDAWGVLGDMLQEAGHPRSGAALSKYHADRSASWRTPGYVWRYVNPDPTLTDGMAPGTFRYQVRHGEEGAALPDDIHELIFRLHPHSENHLFSWTTPRARRMSRSLARRYMR